MEDIHKSLAATFREEAADLLEELETALMELEAAPRDMDVVNRVFRALHTLKGNGSMFGFDGISVFTHDVESVFDCVRAGLIPVTRKLIDLTFSARDVLAAMLEEPKEVPQEVLNSSGTLSGVFRAMAMDAVKEGQEEPLGDEEEYRGSRDESTVRTYRIRFEPDPDILKTGTNLPALMGELGEMGESRTVARLKGIPPLPDYDPETCYVSWDIILSTDREPEEVREVFIFVEDRSRLSIDIVDEGIGEEEAAQRKLGEILVERGDLARDDLERVLSQRSQLGEDLLAKKLVDTDVIEASLMEQEVIRQTRLNRRKEEAFSSVRVASEKLDGIVNLVGELVTVQSNLSQTATNRKDPELEAIAERVERLTFDLRDIAFAVRMVPFGTIFPRFRRLIRDLASETGKEVRLLTEGGETELDKTVIEKLTDPLVHVIRNCIDHGIEEPAEREKLGKNPEGTVVLRAGQWGTDVLIQVIDDGRGLDAKRIREKAEEQGLLGAHDPFSEEEILELVTTPGLSTADEITSISGRGVGLDVVRRSIESLRGVMEIAGGPGEGTTVTIRLPLTLAIIEGLLVRIASERYIMPLSEVLECVELPQRAAARSNGRRLANVRGELVPYIRLREWFGISQDPPPIEQIVLTQNPGGRVGFVVDQVVGEQQTVIKSLGRLYRRAEGISGATILGDGSVALILDIPRLVRIAERLESKGHLECEGEMTQFSERREGQ